MLNIDHNVVEQKTDQGVNYSNKGVQRFILRRNVLLYDLRRVK
ncbi:MAG: hypothetical protein ACI8RD_003636 [Bacillariaceae sp.]|jgi:hypothetical protein